MRKFAAVIGDPIDHSLSPALHLEAYRILGLDWEYKKVRVARQELPGFIDSLPPECQGLSVTAPLKREAVKYAAAVDGLAKLVDAANTLVFSPPMEAAFNTDVQAIVDTVEPALAKSERVSMRTLPMLQDQAPGPLTGAPPPVVIGTGATASSALAAVRSLGASSVYLLGRSFAGNDNAFATANALGLDVHPVLWRVVQRSEEVLSSTSLMISTVPPAATAELAERLDVGPSAVLLDVTYSDGPTPLEAAFQASGAATTSPLTMLTLQGVAQVKLWTARDVPFEPVFEAVVRAARQD